MVQEVAFSLTHKFSQVRAMASSRMLPLPASPQEADLEEMEVEEVEEVEVEEVEGTWKRTRAFMVPAVGLVLLAAGILGIFAAGHVTHRVQEQGIIEGGRRVQDSRASTQSFGRAEERGCSTTD